MSFFTELLIEALSTIIALSILFFVISYFLYFPIKDNLKKREKFLSDKYENANRLNSDAVKTQRAIEEALKNSKVEAEEIISFSKKEAEEIKMKIIEEANLKAKRNIEEGRDQIENERKEMYEKLKADISSISMMAASKIIDKNLDSDLNKKLVEDLIVKIKNEK